VINAYGVFPPQLTRAIGGAASAPLLKFHPSSANQQAQFFQRQKFGAFEPR
jgi:hypothetical protein